MGNEVEYWNINVNVDFILLDMPVYSPIYSLPYVLFLLYLFALFVIERNRINRGYSAAKIQNITWLSLLFFIGFRGFIYTDWFTYYPVYEYLPTIGNTSIQNLDTDWEGTWLCSIYDIT